MSRDIAAVALTIILFLLVGYRPPWWSRKSTKCTKTINHIPGPFAAPLIGTRWLYWPGGYSVTKVHEVYEQFFRKYGPIVKEEALFNIPVIAFLNVENN